MTSEPDDQENAAAVSTLRSQTDWLGTRLDHAHRVSATASTLVAGAAVAMVGSVLPWIVARGDDEFGASAEIGWEVWFGSPAEAMVAVLFLGALVVACVSAFSLSQGLARASFGLSAVVVVVLAALWLLGQGAGDVTRPAVGFYLSVLGYAAIVVGSGIRLRTLRSMDRW